jgi:ATPase subunit of ABC transporter with duplicated ATPase domains
MIKFIQQYKAQFPEASSDDLKSAWRSEERRLEREAAEKRQEREAEEKRQEREAEEKRQEREAEEKRQERETEERRLAAALEEKRQQRIFQLAENTNMADAQRAQAIEAIGPGNSAGNFVVWVSLVFCSLLVVC